MSEPLSSDRAPIRDRAVLATVVLVAVVGFIVLAAVLRVEVGYAGLLFFWYWAGIRDAKFAAMPPILVGACLGIGTAWLLQVATESHHGVLLAAVLLLIVSAIYIQVMDLAPGAINLSYMLFLTVAAAPLLQREEVMPAMVGAVLLAAVYFGAIVAIMTALQARATRARLD